MNIFDIVGPVMVGPSSSHTAGALRIAGVSAKLLGEPVKKAEIKLHGSFARTYRGHGTDRAIIGGLLGFSTDDIRVRDSMELAVKKGVDFRFETADLGDMHPNSVLIQLEGMSGKKLKVLGSSIGGGNIVIKRINELEVEFTGQYFTLIIEHHDRPGMVATVTLILGRKGINIAGMRVYRSQKGGSAIMVIETDQCVDIDLQKEIDCCHDVLGITAIEAI